MGWWADGCKVKVFAFSFTGLVYGFYFCRVKVLGF